MPAIKCYICNEEFEPDPTQLDDWEESGREFDPTDWECPACIKAEEGWLMIVAVPADQVEEMREAGHLAQLKELDEDPRYQDGFARSDWNGDPNEY